MLILKITLLLNTQIIVMYPAKQKRNTKFSLLSGRYRKNIVHAVFIVVTTKFWSYLVIKKVLLVIFYFLSMFELILPSLVFYCQLIT